MSDVALSQTFEGSANFTDNIGCFNGCRHGFSPSILISTMVV